MLLRAPLHAVIDKQSFKQYTHTSEETNLCWKASNYENITVFDLNVLDEQQQLTQSIWHKTASKKCNKFAKMQHNLVCDALRLE